MFARRLVAVVACVFLAHGAGATAEVPSFSRVDLPTGLSLYDRVVAGDFTGDGVPDLLLASHSLIENFGIYLMRGDGHGGFAAPVRIYAAPAGSSLGAADVNGDGTLDISFLFAFDEWILPGHGDGTFGEPIVSPATAGVGRPPVFADVNHDGQVDLVLASQDAGVSISLGHGDGTFAAPALFPVGNGGLANGLAVADFNGDGHPDIAATNPGLPPFGGAATVSILLGRGDGSFGPPSDFSVGAMPLSIVAADFNHDGAIDLAVANYLSASVSVLLGLGDGTFAGKSDYSIGPYAGALATADFDGDGHPDLAVCTNVPSTTLSVLPGTGTGSFAPRTDLPAASGCESIAVSDVNLDGRPDLALNYDSGSGTVSIFLNLPPTPADTIPPTVIVSATPSVLNPPNGKAVQVTLSGRVQDTGSGVNPSTVRFTVVDEYGFVQPQGSLTIDAQGNYRAIVTLVASRRGDDRNGRTYTIIVSAQDRAGNVGIARATVIVPHDAARSRP